MGIGSYKQHWFTRYKIYHVPFWLLYHTCLWTLTIGSFKSVAHNILFTPYSIKFLFYVVLQAGGVYFNLYFLLPRFLEKGKYGLYVLLILLTILVTAILIVPGYYVSSWASGVPFEQLYKRNPADYIYFLQINTLPSSVAAMTLAMSVKLTKKWIQSRQQEQLLKEEKLETELKFLRSQFNPHFLFNTINSIFVLIHKNPAKASDSLAKFSDLLRYQLYECNETKIPLSQEITYLENFIELEKLRQEKDVEVKLEIQRSIPEQFEIAPFILIPFIENAFKHVSREKENLNWIHISLRFSFSDLVLEVGNSISKDISTQEDVIRYGGIGLQNVQRRLNLLYPEQHQLLIRNEIDRYSMSLVLKLQDKPVVSFVHLAEQQAV